MASLYSYENVPLDVVIELRRLGHDVLISYDAENANARDQRPAKAVQPTPLTART